MPTYDYQCGSCGQTFERFHGMDENPRVPCPSCGRPARRLISAGAGIRVKDGRIGTSKGSCSLETAGKTCCGRSQRCEKSPCGRE